MDTTSAQQTATSGTPSGEESPDGARPEMATGRARIERTWWRDRRVGIGAGYVAIVTTIAWLYGVLPVWGRSFPLAPTTSVISWVECLGDGLLTCTYIGYPEGVNLSLGTPLVGATWILTGLGLDVQVAINLLAVLAVAAGVAALWALAASVTGSVLAGALASCLYYLSPVIVVHTSKIGLWFGLVLLPLPLAFAYAGVKLKGRRGLPLTWLILLFFTTMVLVYLDPYAWGIAMVLAGPLCIGGAVAGIRRTGWRGCVIPLAMIVALMVPGLIFKMQEPSAEFSADFPLGFYRAYGVDVVAAIFPTQDSLFGDLVGSPVDRWDVVDFYGDGTQMNGTFIGLFTFVAAVAGAVVLVRRQERLDRLVMLGLTLGGIACLALGLGPSLKVLDKASVPVARIGPDGTAAHTDHVMPASQATLSLPWSWVYRVQPFEGMRTTYRWHVGLRLVLAIFVVVAAMWLFRRRRALAVALFAVVLLESTSHALLDARGHATEDHELVQRFTDDMEQAFGNGGLRASERVLFLPAGNDYLIGAIAPPRELFSYNIAFDKEMARIRPLQPRPILDAITAYSTDTLTRDHVCTLFRQDLVDAVVFDDFDMRRDTLIWPPPKEQLDARRARNAGFGLFDDPAFDVDEGHLAVILRRSASTDTDC